MTLSPSPAIGGTSRCETRAAWVDERLVVTTKCETVPDRRRLRLLAGACSEWCIGDIGTTGGWVFHRGRSPVGVGRVSCVLPVIVVAVGPLVDVRSVVVVL
ncbi:hypothetical protein Dimus_024966 [Dionaea muscipula]